MSSVSPQDILDFWFSPRLRPHWFNSTSAVDEEIRTRFEPTWQAAMRNELAWCTAPEDALALVIVLDQFPLNMYRHQALSFSTEAQGRACAAKAIDAGWDQALEDQEKLFLYLPFMHSETLTDQDRSVSLFESMALEDATKFAHHHRDLIRRFGRFPHRNAALGRESTQEELDYLASDEAFHG